ncbi:MFS transporter small subunit [Nonomuraea sp. LP-02]
MSRRTALMTVAWAWVGLPFAYGIYNLLLKLAQLFA